MSSITIGNYNSTHRSQIANTPTTFTHRLNFTCMNPVLSQTTRNIFSNLFPSDTTFVKKETEFARLVNRTQRLQALPKEIEATEKFNTSQKIKTALTCIALIITSAATAGYAKHFYDAYVMLGKMPAHTLGQSINSGIIQLIATPFIIGAGAAGTSIGIVAIGLCIAALYEFSKGYKQDYINGMREELNHTQEHQQIVRQFCKDNKRNYQRWQNSLDANIRSLEKVINMKECSGDHELALRLAAYKKAKVELQQAWELLETSHVADTAALPHSK